MPTFDTLPLNEARASSATGQRAALLQERTAGPPLRQRRLLLGAGDPATRQAPQEPGRVVPAALPRPNRAHVH